MEGQTGFQPPKQPPSKRLIICCDGTWQAANHATHEVPSNIAKLSRALSKSFINEVGQAVPQIVFYDAGVATADDLDGKTAGYFGSGLDENVCEAYNFLATNYVSGDEVFVFGFSRGAYTARSIAGLVARVGICRDIQMSRFWEMYAVYKTKDPATPLEETEWGKPNPTIAAKSEQELKESDFITLIKGDEKIAPVKVRKGEGASWLAYCHKNIAIKIVGVFDTVGALGWPENILFDVAKWNKPYMFHNTDIYPEFENAFHALALDERRKPFSPTLWTIPKENKTTNLIQCWFPGVHVNIGGGSSDALKKTDKQRGDLENMANTTFAWMVDRCRPFLHFDEKALSWILIAYFDSLAKLISRSDKTEKSGWGIGPIVPTTGGINNIGGYEDRTPGHYPGKIDSREYIHPVVYHAQAANTGWKCGALEGFVRTSLGPGKGFSWVKTYKAKNDDQGWLEWARSLGRQAKKTEAAVTVTLPEFIIPKMVIQQSAHSVQRYYASPLERLLVLKGFKPEWKDELVKEAFGSDRQYEESKFSIVQEQEQTAASQYLKQLDTDNAATKEIGQAVKWGTPL